MENELKKISFGFSKLVKKTNLIPQPIVQKDKIQLIDCVEAQTIKLKDVIEEIKGPLIIPLQQSLGNVLDGRRELKIKQETLSEEKPESELTPDELAARELIRDAQNLSSSNDKRNLILSATTENVAEIEGKPEPTLDDYESVPVQEYGMAMLRGMGWSEGVGIGKNNKCATKLKEPVLRPKGMGLGVNKATKELEKALNDKEIPLTKGCYAKIVDGKQKGNYCEVQGFDDEAGRIIVKTTLQGLILSLNEFLVKPVTKEEYIKSSKVINNAKYEEHKQKIERETKNIFKNDKEGCSSRNKKSNNSAETLKNPKYKKKHRSSSYTSSDSDDYDKSGKDYSYDKRYKKKETDRRHRNKVSSDSDDTNYSSTKYKNSRRSR